MPVWEFKPRNVNDYAQLVFRSDKDIDSGMFDVDGKVLSWTNKPKIEVFVEPREKRAKPLADISALTPGALALNDKANAALETFLSRFGQLLEMDCEDQSRWFYNVTNVVSCIDEERSEKRPTGALSKEEFFEGKVPTEAAVFKDPLTAPVKIHVTEAAKAALEDLIAKTDLVGAAFVLPGPPPKKPRPRA
jgi:hypothetical protein